MHIKGKKVVKRSTKKSTKKMVGGAQQHLNPNIINTLIGSIMSVNNHQNPRFNVRGYLPTREYPNAMVCRLIQMNNHHLLLEFPENHITGLPHHYLLLNNFENFIQNMHNEYQIVDIVVNYNNTTGTIQYVNIMGDVYQAIVGGQEAATQMIGMTGEFGINQDQLHNFFQINNVALVTMDRATAIAAFNALPTNAHINALPIPPVPHANMPPVPPLLYANNIIMPPIIPNLNNENENQNNRLQDPKKEVNNTIPYLVNEMTNNTLGFNQQLINRTRTRRVLQPFPNPMPVELEEKLRDFSTLINTHIVPSVILNGENTSINNFECPVCYRRFNNNSVNKKAIHLGGEGIPYCPHVICKQCLHSSAESACVQSNTGIAPSYIVNCPVCRKVLFDLR
jgi:hypothetical protein